MLRTIASSTCLVLFLLLPGNAPTPRVNALPADSPPAASEPPQPIDPVTGMPAGPGAAATTAPAAPDAAPSIWVEYEDNPVLGLGEPASWDADTVGLPSIMFKDGVYKMWYGGTSNSNTVIRIGYATSPDRVTWTKHAGNPVLSEGPPGAWDSGYVFSPAVIFHNGVYHMWYRGANVTEVTAAAAFGYATSTDGVTWVKHASNPVLRVGPEGSWDSMSLWSLSVLVEGNTFKMWYSARNAAWQYQIGYATSTNGIKWKKHAQNPVLRIGGLGAWDAKFAYFPHVIASGGLYEMWYTGSSGDSAAIGYATSADGITWHKPAANQVMWTGWFYDWDEGWVGGQYAILDHGVYRMWYTGADRFGKVRIGYATAPPPFDLAVHGYRFANAGGGSPIGASDLRTADLIRLFGVDAVCWSSAAACSVKPTAEMWRAQANATLVGGQSDGMAVTSLRYYLGFDQTEQFQPGALVAHDLQADSSRHNIALYQARQLVNPVRLRKHYARTETQGSMIYSLKGDPAGNGAYADTLYLRQAGMGGHTLIPYALEDRGNGVYWVKVYDANHPDDPNRHVVLTTADES